MRDDRALLAIETGGSRGRAAMARGGSILERSLAVDLNPNDTGFDLFGRRLGSLLIPLLAHLRAGQHSPMLSSASLDVVAGIAGAGDPQIMERCRSILERLLKPYASRLRLKAMTDVGALAGACIGDGTGIVLIAGTGSICLGLGKRGGRRVRRRVGGRGSFLDPGSGSTLGLAILDAALATLDGRMNEEVLVGLICDRYGIRPEEIPPRFLPPDRREVAGLARVALEAYAAGDSFARAAVRSSARDLVGLVLEVRETLKIRKGVKVFASGGLFASPVVRRLFSRNIARRLPGARVTFVDDPLMRILGEFTKMGSGTGS